MKYPTALKNDTPIYNYSNISTIYYELRKTSVRAYHNLYRKI